MRRHGNRKRLDSMLEEVGSQVGIVAPFGIVEYHDSIYVIPSNVQGLERGDGAGDAA